MENPVSFGAMLMVIGMSTVFIILALVVLGGKVTIAITNRFSTDKSTRETRTTIKQNTNAPKIAAITAAVDLVTEGQGRIVEINRINQ